MSPVLPGRRRASQFYDTVERNARLVCQCPVLSGIGLYSPSFFRRKDIKDTTAEKVCGTRGVEQEGDGSADHLTR